MLRGGSCLEVIVSQSFYFGQLFSWGDEGVTNKIFFSGVLLLSICQLGSCRALSRIARIRAIDNLPHIKK